MPDIVVTGSGPWAVIIWCYPDLERHQCKTRAEAQAYRCPTGCYRLHFILEPKPAAGVFSFEVPNETDVA